MSLLSSLPVLWLSGLALSLPLDDKLDCPLVLYSPSLANLPPSFPGVVAHGSHSLTLPDIRRYFPTQNTHIWMPVLNPDLLASESIIFALPDFNHTFNSPAMEIIDRVLSHMNEPDHDLPLYSDLEKLVHAAHMQDIWQKASAEYLDIQASGGVDRNLCACMRDVDNNGVVRMLQQVAWSYGRMEGWSYFEQAAKSQAGEEDVKKATDKGDEKVKDYHSNFMYTFNKDEETAGKKDLEEEDDTLLPHLETKENWATWKTMMIKMIPQMEEYSMVLAKYMYCMLN